jgi:hypothetical protein
VSALAIATRAQLSSSAHDTQQPYVLVSFLVPLDPAPRDSSKHTNVPLCAVELADCGALDAAKAAACASRFDSWFAATLAVRLVYACVTLPRGEWVSRGSERVADGRRNVSALFTLTSCATCSEHPTPSTPTTPIVLARILSHLPLSPSLNSSQCQ